MQKRILLIEPMSELREVYAKYLTDHGGYIIIENGTGLDIEELYSAERFDILMTNLTFRKGAGVASGIEVLKEVATIAPHVKRIGMSMFFHAGYEKELRELDADAYIVKSMFPDKLLDILQKVVQGGKYYASE